MVRPTPGPTRNYTLFTFTVRFRTDDDRNDAHVEFGTRREAAITDAFPAKAVVVLEPVRDPDPGDDRFFFEDHGLYAEELFGEYDAGGRFAVRAGKFGQKFGMAWDVAPGIWGTYLAEVYALADQLGPSGALRFVGAGAGTTAASLHRKRGARGQWVSGGVVIGG